jgi:hypothetical protein
MGTFLIILAMAFYMGAVATGSNFIKFKNEWKCVAVSYSLLVIGAVIFGIALTLDK